jgi:membrane-bound metal-dependent hydrolase YbcI (DUF457 family)
MMSYTHIAFGIMLFGIISSTLGLAPTVAVLAVAAIASLLPDIDHPKSVLGIIFFPVSTYISRKYGHRTITHSLAFVVVVAASTTPLFLVHWSYWLAIVIGVVSHIVADGMNVSGIPLMWPSPRPYYFMNEKLLVKVGSPGEMMYFGAFTFGALMLTGVSFFGFRSILHNMIPGFNGAVFEYAQECDGPGEKYICFVDAKVCAEYCGPVSGTPLGMYNNKLIVWNKQAGYQTLDKGSVLWAKLDEIGKADIKSETREFHNEPLEFEKPADQSHSIITVSGDLAGTFMCLDNSNIDPVFSITKDKIALHHILLDDLLAKQCNGFVNYGKLEYKIRQSQQA